ncbi:MAG TPA: hypothetical protein PKE40_02695 [Arachnia sp.]|nr:hypothetical protein [Arachnia sp.]HMT85239.1 hypothetical protein [Arachnia sp.]
MNDNLSRTDLEAALEVRRELGESIEPGLVDSLATKVEETVRRRYDAEFALRANQKATMGVSNAQRVTIAIVSLVMAIPLTAIAASLTGLIGMVLVWTGIVAINIALALRPPQK